MPQLQINTPDGRTEQRRLSRRNPIVIGRNPISDIHIDDESVAAIHCRVIWNGKAFEVAAVANSAIDVNGVLVRRKELSEGDILRIGGVDLVVLNGKEKPDHLDAQDASPKRGGVPQGKVPATVASEAQAQLDADEWSGLSGGEIEFDTVTPPEPRRPSRPAPNQEPVPNREEVQSQPAEEPDDVPVLLDEPPGRPKEKQKGVEPRAAATTARTWARAKRPGEQDVLSSPLVLGLGGLALVLLLAAGAIWLLMGREAADRLYATASSDREAGRYSQAIRGFEQFLIEYPTDDRALEARFALGLARIERYAMGSTPNYEKAIQEFDTFVRTNRDAPDFAKQRSPLRNIARQMTSSAAAAAMRTGDRKYLVVAEKSRVLFERYSSAESANDAANKRLVNDLAKAEASVRKFEFTDVAAESITAAITKNDFASAFKTRRDLLTRYPDLKDDRRIRSLLEKTLSAEQVRIGRIEDLATTFPQDAANVRGSDDDAVMLVGHAQARAGEVSDGRAVFAVAQGALVGLEAVTGEPRWKRTIGLDPPFFPIEVDASLPALLVFDSIVKAALVVERETGNVLWQTVLGSPVAGPPLIAQGQADFATLDGRLIRLDLESGQITDAISFPQPLVGPPVLDGSGGRIIVFGEQATAYTLDRGRLEPKAVSFTGHSAGAIQSPPQALGRLIILCENDQLDSASVRAFSCHAESGKLLQVDSKSVTGHVRQRAIPRGNQLFVPSSPERITAFSVSDDPGQPALTQLATIQIPNAKEVATFLVPGPDGLLWAAGSALRKLRLGADGLSLLPDEVAAGRHTQPPQESGESLFVARSLPSAQAIYVSQADRTEMRGSWRTVLGARIVAVAPGQESATFVNEAGGFGILNAVEMKRDVFFKTRALNGWDELSAEPLQGAALPGRNAVSWRSGSPPQLWRVSAGNPPSGPESLQAMPECPPIQLEGGLVVPLPGRLDWLPGAGGEEVDSLLLPVQEKSESQPKWRSLAAIDDEQFIALDDQDTLRLVRVRSEPIRHLDEVATTKLSVSPTQPLAVCERRVVVVAKDRVQLVDPSGLRLLADQSLKQSIQGGPWCVADTILVQLENGEVLALDPSMLAPRWSAQLNAPLAGQPLLREDHWILTSQEGDVQWIDRQGAVVASMFLMRPIDDVCVIGDEVFALGLDGTLHLISIASDLQAERGGVEASPTSENSESPAEVAP